MIGRVSQVVSLWSLFLLSLSAWAQLDSSSAVLIRPNSKSANSTKLDSTRYKMRAPESRKDEVDEDDEQPGTYIPSPVPKSPKESAVKPSLATPVQTAVPPPPVVAPAPAPVVDERPPVTVQVRQLILGGSDSDIDDAKKQIHPEDPRSNLIGITLSPAYFYDGSTSNYSYRNYHSDGPGLGLGMKLWLTPFFGIESKYFTSVGSSVRDAGNMVPLSEQEFQAGLRFRRHFGYTRKSAQLSWGIDYHDSSHKISSAASSVVGHKTSGLSLSLEGEVPSSVTYSHLFETSISPSQHHSEMDTAVQARSGTHVDSNSISLSVGGQWTLDRRDQIFWKVQYSVERDLFDGATSQPDPKTGLAPDGVSVTNSLAIFYFGFKWGS